MGDEAYLAQGTLAVHADTGVVVQLTETIVVEVGDVENGVASVLTPQGTELTVDNSHLVYKIDP